MLLNPKHNPIRDVKHRKFIASLPCAACRTANFTQCAHIGRLGMGIKSGDDLTVPLCAVRPGQEGCHTIQHRIGEEKFWERFGGVDKAKELAQQLYAVSGNWEKACGLIVRFR